MSQAPTAPQDSGEPTNIDTEIGQLKGHAQKLDKSDPESTRHKAHRLLDSWIDGELKLDPKYSEMSGVTNLGWEFQRALDDAKRNRSPRITVSADGSPKAEAQGSGDGVEAIDVIITKILYESGEVHTEDIQMAKKEWSNTFSIAKAAIELLLQEAKIEVYEGQIDAWSQVRNEFVPALISDNRTAIKALRAKQSNLQQKGLK